MLFVVPPTSILTFLTLGFCMWFALRLTWDRVILTLFPKLTLLSHISHFDIFIIPLISYKFQLIGNLLDVSSVHLLPTHKTKGLQVNSISNSLTAQYESSYMYDGQNKRTCAKHNNLLFVLPLHRAIS